MPDLFAELHNATSGWRLARLEILNLQARRREVQAEFESANGAVKELLRD